MIHLKSGKATIFLFLFVLVATFIFGQGPTLTTISSLPTGLEESSGLLVNGPNSIWTHNDSGGEAKLYELDSTGALVRTLVIRNASNVDWEDLAKDDQGRFYIGDIGNNSNNRTNLRIYRIANPDSIVGDTADAEIISYSYADQAAFPPADSLLQFDVEGMIVLDDSIYLFSKNRTNPYDGICKIYRLPADTGTHIATTIGQFGLGTGSREENWVTAAANSPDGEHVIVLSGTRFWLFSCFSGNDFQNGALKRLTHGAISQKEAIDFTRDGRVYVTDEVLAGLFGGNLYKSDLRNWLWEPAVDLGADTTVFGDSLVLDAGNPGATYTWSDGSSASTLSATTSGIYSVTVTAPNNCTATDSILLDLMVGINNPEESQVELFPQPADQVLQFRTPFREIYYQLFSLSGQLLAEGAENSMDVVQIPDGLYLLIIHSSGERIHQKVLIQH